MRIIIDAMGGDNAPGEIVAGVLRAARMADMELVLVGRGAEVLEALKEKGVTNLPKGMEIANAEDVVDMHDDPATVIRKRRDSSLVVGLRMLADGKGDAFISAGSTGAVLTAATLIVKRIPGIRRAALAPVLPTAAGKCVLVDCGANAECTPEFLLQFGCMGSFFAQRTLGIEKPRVGLLNIGAEDSKGTDLQRAAYGMLQRLSERGGIHFIGNIEGRDVMLGGADVVVSDGFSGNILLKSIEGTGKFMSDQLKGLFMRNAGTKLAALLCKQGIRDLKRLMDYREVGGTPFLGITKPIVKAHGSSDALAISNAVRQAAEAVSSGLVAAIEENIDLITVPKELEHHA
ncbi:MAG: phosphate acyltransferase PlsX [Oscillospiraceae bacterium]|nr:phosphate acyltransferase PlsX [Oscillospiraceae bacterium]